MQIGWAPSGSAGAVAPNAPIWPALGRGRAPADRLRAVEGAELK